MLESFAKLVKLLELKQHEKSSPLVWNHGAAPNLISDRATWRDISLFYFKRVPCRCFYTERRDLSRDKSLRCDNYGCRNSFSRSNDFVRCSECRIAVYCSATCQELYHRHCHPCKKARRYSPHNSEYVDFKIPNGNDDVTYNRKYLELDEASGRQGTIYLPKNLLDRRDYVDQLQERYSYFEKLWRQKKLTARELEDFDVLEWNDVQKLAKELSFLPKLKCLTDVIAKLRSLKNGQACRNGITSHNRFLHEIRPRPDEDDQNYTIEITLPMIVFGAIRQDLGQALCRAIKANAAKFSRVEFINGPEALADALKENRACLPSKKDLQTMATSVGERLGRLKYLRTVVVHQNSYDRSWPFDSTSPIVIAFEHCRGFQELHLAGCGWDAHFFDDESLIDGKGLAGHVASCADVFNLEKVATFDCLLALPQLKKLRLECSIETSDRATAFNRLLGLEVLKAELDYLEFTTEEITDIVCSGLESTRIRHLDYSWWKFPKSKTTAVAKALTASTLLENLSIRSVVYGDDDVANVDFYLVLGQKLAASSVRDLHVEVDDMNQSCFLPLLSNHACQWRITSVTLDFEDHIWIFKQTEHAIADYIGRTQNLKSLIVKCTESSNLQDYSLGRNGVEDVAPLASLVMLDAVEAGEGHLDSIQFQVENRDKIFDAAWVNQMEIAVAFNKCKRVAALPSGPLRQLLIVKALRAIGPSLCRYFLRGDKANCLHILVEMAHSPTSSDHVQGGTGSFCADKVNQCSGVSGDDGDFDDALWLDEEHVNAGVAAVHHAGRNAPRSPAIVEYNPLSLSMNTPMAVSRVGDVQEPNSMRPNATGKNDTSTNTDFEAGRMLTEAGESSVLQGLVCKHADKEDFAKDSKRRFAESHRNILPSAAAATTGKHPDANESVKPPNTTVSQASPSALQANEYGSQDEVFAGTTNVLQSTYTSRSSDDK
jgi:hypothetical protein